MTPQTGNGDEPFPGTAFWERVHDQLASCGFQPVSRRGKAIRLAPETWGRLTTRLRISAQLLPDCACPPGGVNSGCPRHGARPNGREDHAQGPGNH